MQKRLRKQRIENLQREFESTPLSLLSRILSSRLDYVVY